MLTRPRLSLRLRPSALDNDIWLDAVKGHSDPHRRRCACVRLRLAAPGVCLRLRLPAPISVRERVYVERPGLGWAQGDSPAGHLFAEKGLRSVRRSVIY